MEGSPIYVNMDCGFDCPFRRIRNPEARADERSGKVFCSKYEVRCFPDERRGVWLRCVPCVTDRNNP